MNTSTRHDFKTNARKRSAKARAEESTDGNMTAYINRLIDQDVRRAKKVKH